MAQDSKAISRSLGDARGAYRLALRQELLDLSHTVFATRRSLLTDPKTIVAVRQRLVLAYLARWQFADAKVSSVGRTPSSARDPLVALRLLQSFFP